MMYRILFVGFCCLCFTIAIGQNADEVLQNAAIAEAEGNMIRAAELYDDFLSQSEDLTPSTMRQAANIFFQTGQFDKAEKLIVELSDSGKDDDPGKSLALYARLLHEKGSYQKAIELYKESLKWLPADQQDYIKKRIIHARYAWKVEDMPRPAFIDNLGPSINSPYHDIAPIFDLDKNVLYFSSNRATVKGGKRDADGFLDDEFGSYAYDMFVGHRKNGDWNTVTSSGGVRNTARNEILYDLSDDGRAIFFYRGLNLDFGDVLVDSFRAGMKEGVNARLFQTPFDPVYGDKDLYLVNDSVILFASVREGGQGGYDLYYSVYSNDSWDRATPLPASINSPYHDRCPQLTEDGYLYFSSDRLESIGGYDVFYSRWNGSGWDRPTHLGHGINSPSDELYFRRVKGDAKKAYFASNRKDLTLGEFDIYQSVFKENVPAVASFELPVLWGEPDPPVSERKSLSTPSPVSPVGKWIIRPLLFPSDPETLQNRQKVKLQYIAEQLKAYPKLKIALFSFVDFKQNKIEDLHRSLAQLLLCIDYLESLGVSNSQLHGIACGSEYPIVPQGQGDSQSRNQRIDFRLEGDIPMSIHYDPYVEANILEGSPYERCMSLLEGVSFSVQIAATNKELSGDGLASNRAALLHIEGEYSVFKYTLGIFDRYEQAQQLRQQLIRQGNEGAFVTAYINGIRKKREELHDYVEQFPELQAYINLE